MDAQKQYDNVSAEVDLFETLSEEEINEFCEANEPDEHYCPHVMHDSAWQNGINH